MSKQRIKKHDSDIYKYEDKGLNYFCHDYCDLKDINLLEPELIDKLKPLSNQLYRESGLQVALKALYYLLYEVTCELVYLH